MQIVKIISASLNKPGYGLIVVLEESAKTWEGHVGFLINYEEVNGTTYAYLLGGNQNDKVCVQQFEVYKAGNIIKYKTKRGKKLTLKAYVYPEEYNLPTLADHSHSTNYRKDGYTVEEAITTR